MKVIDKLEYKNFQTVVKLTKEVEEFLLKNNIDPKLSSRIPNIKHWYEYNPFPTNHLKDKETKHFELIYCGVIRKPEEYESLENIMKTFKLTKEDVIFDGSITLLELKNTFIRWIVIKN